MTFDDHPRLLPEGYRIRHELKTWPEFFARVWSGEKKCELRREDTRRFNVGDTAILREYEPTVAQYTGRTVEVRITDVVRDAPQWGLDPGSVIFSFDVAWRQDADLGDSA